MPLELDPQACDLMKDQVRKTNGPFFDPSGILTKNEFDNATEFVTMKNIHGKPLKAYSKKEFERMRYEEFCFIHFKNGTYASSCFPLKNKKGALAGGKIERMIHVPSDYQKKVYTFHNHPLYRETFPSDRDILSHFNMITDTTISPNKIKDVFACIGEMDYQGTSHVLCYNFKEPYLKKARYFNTEINKMEKYLDDQITRGEITEKKAIKILNESSVSKSFDKFMTNLSEKVQKKWNNTFYSIQRDDFGYLVHGEKNKDGIHTYSYHSIPSKDQRRNLLDGFKQEFSDVLEFGECK